MKYLLFVSIFTLLFCFSINGQTPLGKTILEVHQSSFGMVGNPGNYLLVRVLDNGKIEYQESVVENNEQNFNLKSHQLSALKLKELKDFLSKSEIEKIAQEYSPDVPTIDHYIEFSITITLDTKSQAIKLINYSPNTRSAEDKYPQELFELMCRIRALRNNSGFWLLKNDCVLNNKDKN